MKRILTLAILLVLSFNITAQTDSPEKQLLRSNIQKLQTLVDNLNSSTSTSDLIPWYIQEDKDSITTALEIFKHDLQRAKDSIEHYFDNSFTHGGGHTIRFVYENDLPHSSIHVIFEKNDTLARIIQVDDWLSIQKVVKEYKTQSKGVWDIPPPPLPPIPN